MKRSTFFTLLAILVVVAVLVVVLVYLQDKSGIFNRNNDQGGTGLTTQISGQATVGDIEIQVQESFPVRVNVIAYGTLPDGCTEIGDVTNQREGSVFRINIETNRPQDQVCTQVIRQFQRTIPLNVDGLAAGDYFVNVNGIQKVFTLALSNQINFEEGLK